MERLTELLSNLELDDDKVKTLEGIKPALSSFSRKESEDGLKDLNLLPIFDCLHSNDTDLVKTSVDVLQYLLNFSDPALVLERYGSLMHEGLSSKTTPDCVLLLIIRQLKRSATDDDLVQLLLKQSLLQPLLTHLKSDLSVSTELTLLLVSLADTRPGLQALTSAETQAQLSEIASSSSIMMMRVLEMSVKIAQLSQDHLQAVEKIGLLSQLVSILNSSDFLLQLNCIELLTQLAICSHGQIYLETAGVMNKLGIMLNDCPNMPFADIIMPGLVKFWGNVAHLRPGQILSQYPAFVTALISMFQSKDDTIQSVAFETIGYIGVSLEGKTALLRLENMMLECVEKLGLVIRDSSTELKITALNSLASLLKLDNQHQTADMINITQTWYNQIPNMAPTLINVVKQPFLDLRLAAYQLLMVLCGQSWGRREVLLQPGFCEYLLDRSNEREGRGRQERWSLISRMVESRETKELLGPEMDVQMRQYVRDGPHFVQTQSQVAFEEQQ